MENHAPADCLVTSLVILALRSDVVKLILVVEKFIDMFLEDLSELLLRREIEFAIKLVLKT